MSFLKFLDTVTSKNYVNTIIAGSVEAFCFPKVHIFLISTSVIFASKGWLGRLSAVANKFYSCIFSPNVIILFFLNSFLIV